MPDQKEINKAYARESRRVLGVAFELGFIIALPITALALLGKYWDRTHHTNYFVYIGIALAVIITSSWVYKRFADMIKRLEEAAKQNKK